MSRLFERIVMVDWSAAAKPTLGADSIWIAVADSDRSLPRPVNYATRHNAIAALRDLCTINGKVLIGFDFAFGYPHGTAPAFGEGWAAIWAWLPGEVHDAADNDNNRFDVASRFNTRFAGEGPLWGHPPGRTYTALRPTKPTALPAGLNERRIVETLVRRTQPTGKLAYPGSVGSQTLLGIARLEDWRRDEALGPRTAIWPFETGFADNLDAQIVIAEIFPSMHPITSEDDEVRDAAQVRTLAAGYTALDRKGELREHLQGPSRSDWRDVALAEEGWIMSVTDAPIPLAA